MVYSSHFRMGEDMGKLVHALARSGGLRGLYNTVSITLSAEGQARLQRFAPLVFLQSPATACSSVIFF